MIDKICENIRDNFDGADVFIEEVDEGIIYPCFFVRLVNSDIKREFRGLLIVDESYSVTYVTNDDYIPSGVVLKLMRCLETVDGVRSLETSADIVKDEVGSTLVCLATYSKRYREFNKDEYMLYLKQRALSKKAED